MVWCGVVWCDVMCLSEGMLSEGRLSEDVMRWYVMRGCLKVCNEMAGYQRAACEPVEVVRDSYHVRIDLLQTETAEGGGERVC